MKKLLFCILVSALAANPAEAEKKKVYTLDINNVLPFRDYQSQMVDTHPFSVKSEGYPRWRNDRKLLNTVTIVTLKAMRARERFQNASKLLDKSRVYSIDEVNVSYADLSRAQLLVNMLLGTHELNNYVMFTVNQRYRAVFKTSTSTDGTLSYLNTKYDKEFAEKNLPNNDTIEATKLNAPRGEAYLRFIDLFFRATKDLNASMERIKQSGEKPAEYYSDLENLSLFYGIFIGKEVISPNNIQNQKDLAERLVAIAERRNIDIEWKELAPFKGNWTNFRSRLLHEIALDIESDLKAATDDLTEKGLCDTSAVDKECSPEIAAKLENYLLNEKLKHLRAEKIMAELQYCNVIESIAIKLDEFFWGYHWWWPMNSELLGKAQAAAKKEFEEGRDQGWKAK